MLWERQGCGVMWVLVGELPKDERFRVGSVILIWAQWECRAVARVQEEDTDLVCLDPFPEQRHYSERELKEKHGLVDGEQGSKALQVPGAFW